MRESVTFDRAADYYDATRAIPEEIKDQLISMLRDELIPFGRCLEIGVGTGRFALPLSETGVAMTGIDLSTRMMQRLISNSQDSTRVLLARADATRLPFGTGTFGSAIACHVLHLIPDWKGAVKEMMRTTLDEGILLIDSGHASVEQRALETFLQERFGAVRVGVQSQEELDAFFQSEGFEATRLTEITTERERIPERFVRGVEQDQYSFTWDADAERAAEIKRSVRAWAKERYGELEAPVKTTTSIVWTRYERARSSGEHS